MSSNKCILFWWTRPALRMPLVKVWAVSGPNIRQALVCIPDRQCREKGGIEAQNDMFHFI